MKKHICILDTETIVKGQKVFDVGIIIATVDGEIIHEQQWYLRETFFQKLFYEEKRDLYRARLDSNEYPCSLVTAKECFEEMNNIFEFFKVEEVYAYNAGFDTRVVKKLAEELGLKNPLENKIIECLWFWSTQTILLQKGFGKFATENNWLTPKGNYKTSAEATFAYITNQAEFVEEHTALEDCRIELEIYKHCKKQKKARVRGLAGNPWLIPQPEEQIQKLPPQFRSMKINLQSRLDEAEQMEKLARLLERLGKGLDVEIDVTIGE